MKLTVLGNYGPYPKAGGACSGYLVEDNGTKILLDMGAGTLSRLLSLTEPESLAGIVISHSHFDHTGDLLPFRYLLEQRKMQATVFARDDGTEWSRLLLGHSSFNVVEYGENIVLKAGGLTLKFFLMEHSATSYAVLAEGTKKLFYTGDTRMNARLIEAATGADCILADCCQPVGAAGGHMSVEQGVELQRKTGARLIATHLSPDYDPREYFAPYTAVTVGEEMRCYEI